MGRGKGERVVSNNGNNVKVRYYMVRISKVFHKGVLGEYFEQSPENKK